MGGEALMDRKRLEKHIRLCRRNLKDGRTKCCATCPFEEEILSAYPELEELFEAKRKAQEEESKE